jgi:cation:H+ antiporter
VPLVVSQQLVRFDVPLMIGLSFLLYVVSLDGRVGRGDGLLLFGGLIVYTVWAIIISRKEQAAVAAEYEQEFGRAGKSISRGGVAIQLVLLAAGLFLLVLGSRWFSDSAVTIAREFGVSELVIGLTIVAAGTSLPEVATSLLAALRGERDIAVGNVVGSNIFNIMGVLGLSSAVAAKGISVSPQAVAFDIPVMIAVAVACLPIFFTGHVIARWEGAVFFGYYCAYTAYLILDALNKPAVHAFERVVLLFVVPITFLTLLVCVLRAWRSSSESRNSD